MLLHYKRKGIIEKFIYKVLIIINIQSGKFEVGGHLYAVTQYVKKFDIDQMIHLRKSVGWNELKAMMSNPQMDNLFQYHMYGKRKNDRIFECC